MPRGALSNLFAGCIRSQLTRRMRQLTNVELCESALIIAPHQDDETLGCGGTIIRKRKLGAHVHVVYMTDGSRSHDGRIARRELAAMRAQEALIACETLGVKRDHVHFLNIENGELENPDERESATRMLVERLTMDMPKQVFVPYHRDPPPDHFITTAVALAAIDRLELNVSVYEYPIWFWHFWPFSWDSARTLREFARRYRTMLRHVPCAIAELRVGVDVRDELEIKRAALEAHATQMARRGGDPSWPILDDVCDGAFTELFFQPIEWFHESRRAPSTSSAMETLAPLNTTGAAI